MNDKKKKYVSPDAELIFMNNEEIITASGDIDWGNDDNTEDFGGLFPKED